MRYDDAVAALFQVPLGEFIAERKRLAGELKAAGDKDGAAQLAKLGRPPISAWAVNQLWWHARDAFDQLLATARRLRDGELDAMAAHREAIASLRARSARMLTDAGHGATEATLRRVTTSLAALAAAGGWQPGAPGALSADRDPPGFEAAGIAPRPARPASAPADTHDARAEREAGVRHEREAAAARAEAAAAQRRVEAERARLAAERHRIEAALRTAHGDVAQREREVVTLERDLARARDQVAHAKAVVRGLEERLAQLGS